MLPAEARLQVLALQLALVDVENCPVAETTIGVAPTFAVVQSAESGVVTEIKILDFKVTF